MRAASIPFLMSLLFARALTQSAPGQPPQAVAVDAYGDPLPDGAVARLGTVRWRHGGEVGHLAYSTDGKRLVTAGEYDGTVCLWDAESGRMLKRVVQSSYVRCTLAIAGDKVRAACWKGDAIWALEVTEGKEIFRQNDPAYAHTNAPGYSEGWILVAKISPDGSLLAGGTVGGGVRLWDLKEGKFLRELKGNADRLNTMLFSPNGKRLAASGEKGVRVWDLASGEAVPAPEAPMKLLAFSPDGNGVALEGMEEGDKHRIHLWDIPTKRGRTLGEAPGSLELKALFSPDGKTLALFRELGEVELREVETGKSLCKLPGSGIRAAAFSPDGKTFGAGGRDAMLLWETASGKLLHRAEGGYECSVGCAAFSPDGTSFATAASWCGIVRLFDRATGKPRYSPGAEYENSVAHCLFSRDGRKLFTMGNDGRVMVWDLKTGQKLSRYLWFDFHYAKAAAFSRDRSKMASVMDGGILVVDAESGRTLHMLGEFESRLAVCFSSDGKLLAGGTDRRVSIWDAATGKKIRDLTLGREVYGFGGVEFSPDGRKLAVHGAREILMWDLEAGKELYKLQNADFTFLPDSKSFVARRVDNLPAQVLDLQTGTVTGEIETFSSLAFSSDGKTMALTRPEGGVCLYDVETLKRGAEFKGSSGNLAVFSPDGQELAMAGDTAIDFWDVKSATRRRSLPVGRANHIAFSPDWAFLASAGGDSTVLIWKVGTETKR